MEEHSPEYPFDAESIEELERLLLQGSLLSQGMLEAGTLFPQALQTSERPLILDLACGPADWLMTVAELLPQAQLLGLDKSQRLIEYNKDKVSERRLSNIFFAQGDITTPLPFPDASFDLVTGRLVFSFLNPDTWGRLLQECQRILKPGGMIQLTEGERGLTNSRAANTLETLLATALQRSGATFAVDETHWGIVENIGTLLRRAGFEHVTLRSALSEFSHGLPAHEPTFQVYRSSLWTIQPFIMRFCPEITAEAYRLLYQQMLGDFVEEGFSGIFLFVTAVGRKAAIENA